MSDTERLYELLPAAMRTRDAGSGEALRALMAILDEQRAALEADIETTWDNWFIETCEEWVVPYIGEALGVRGLRDVEAADFSLRTYVANTLARRRRKGTVAATEDLAFSLTGYPARAVEMFALTATTVNVNHVRDAGQPGVRLGSVDLRDTAAVAGFDGPFDPFVRTPDIRPMTGNRVRHNLANVGLFFWRLRSMRISESTAREDPLNPLWRRFDPLGADLGVFNLPEGQASIEEPAGPEHAPHALTRLELDGFEPGQPNWPVAVRVETDDGLGGVGVEELTVRACNLADIGGALPARQPAAAGTVLVDPELGRLVLHPDDVGGPGTIEVLVDHAYGWPGRVGAGPYDRGDELLARLDSETVVFQCGVGRRAFSIAGEPIVPTLEEAVVEWNTFINNEPAADRPGAVGVIAVMDSRTYAAPATRIELPDGSILRIIAADWPEEEVDGAIERRAGRFIATRVRPHVVGDITARGSAVAATEGEIEFNGLLIEGRIRIAPGALAKLRLTSCTVNDPNAAVAVGAGPAGNNEDLEITVERSVVGPVVAVRPVARLDVADSFVGSAAVAIDLDGAAVDIASSTIRGSVTCRTFDAGNSVLDEGDGDPAAMFRIAQTQMGCIRFSSVPPGAATPRRYRCQPDLALEGVTDVAERLRIIGSMHPVYGVERVDPGFGLLRLDAPPALRTASADGSEPGVWHHLQHARRMSNLSLALRQYLRYGLDAGYVLDR